MHWIIQHVDWSTGQNSVNFLFSRTILPDTNNIVMPKQLLMSSLLSTCYCFFGEFSMSIWWHFIRFHQDQKWNKLWYNLLQIFHNKICQVKMSKCQRNYWGEDYFTRKQEWRFSIDTKWLHYIHGWNFFWQSVLPYFCLCYRESMYAGLMTLHKILHLYRTDAAAEPCITGDQHIFALPLLLSITEEEESRVKLIMAVTIIAVVTLPLQTYKYASGKSADTTHLW